MGRAKRKWTRETIEEALRQNARVNAIPAQPEETTEKRKRQRRRANKKHNLLKELEALSVAESEVVILAANTVHIQTIPQDSTTLEQEGKQEEDDPAEQHRFFAAAYAAGLCQAAPETEPHVTRASSEDRAATTWARNAEQQRARRANMTASQTERRRAKDRLPPITMCPLCQAWKWPAESDFICCPKGRVQLPPLQPAPPRLLQLYGDKEFRHHVRTYNQAFAFTSIGASSSDNTFRDVNQDQRVAGQHGVYTYRIQGAMWHYMGSMLPYVDRRTGERVPPKFAQIYIVDPDMQERANRRQGIFADLDIAALQDIENMMVECNPFAQQFLSFGQKLREGLAMGMQVKDIRYVLHSKPSEPRTYNLPTVSEVGVAMIEDGNLTRPRDLYVVAKDHSLLRLFETDEKYDPLQYPLLFPYGDLGWTYTDVYANGAN
ncbi:unnamed protein product [Phytophthora fragariaefolia]|uniref:Unnamed protein product n=1 Tax=Phytophthora fragariaefolia TaxID=1490495 RepID=A0A9W6XS63_9STRA|nr:unnamed protein product [Phytophthora fragariaefolia]